MIRLAVLGAAEAAYPALVYRWLCAKDALGKDSWSMLSSLTRGAGHPSSALPKSLFAHEKKDSHEARLRMSQ